MGFGVYEIVKPLPHPPIPLAVLLKVEEALCVAWERLRFNPKPGFELLKAEEDVVTNALHKMLFDEVFDKRIVAGFDRQVFSVMTRDSKVNNFDGSKLDLMPDLLIGLSNRKDIFLKTQDWLFVECKPVDLKHSVGKHYCDKGIIRFVRGDYAWAMRDALMIGYVCNGYTIPSKLSKALNTRMEKIPTNSLPCPCCHSKPGIYSEVVCVSRHNRTFKYVENDLPAPEIMIRHLWLKRD